MTKTIVTEQDNTKSASTNKQNVLIELVEVFSLWVIAATIIVFIGLNTWA